MPESIEVDGELCPIDFDFRPCIRTILAFEDDELTLSEKAAVMLDNLYLTPPANLSKASEMALWFLNGGKEDKNDGDGLRLYSFTKDADFIFAAFRQTHGINLQAEKIHWWKFLALFMDLGADTTFCNLTSLRRRVKTGKATKEEKAAAREMGDLFDVPEIDNRTFEEKEQEREFLELVGAARRKT